MILGNDIIIMEDGVAVAASRSCSPQTESEAREVSSPYSGKWRDYRCGRQGWALSLNFIVGNLVDSLLHSGKRVHLVIRARDAQGNLTNDYVEGDALCTLAKVDATRGSISQGSWNFLGCGELIPAPYNLRDVFGTYLHDSNDVQLQAPRY